MTRRERRYWPHCMHTLHHELQARFCALSYCILTTTWGEQRFSNSRMHQHHLVDLLKQRAGPSPRVSDLEVNLVWAGELVFLTKPYMVLSSLLMDWRWSVCGFSPRLLPWVSLAVRSVWEEHPELQGMLMLPHAGATEVDAVMTPIL